MGDISKYEVMVYAWFNNQTMKKSNKKLKELQEIREYLIQALNKVESKIQMELK